VVRNGHPPGGPSRPVSARSRSSSPGSEIAAPLSGGGRLSGRSCRPTCGRPGAWRG
jgi:hypothetical protein